jgi:hypothetical protein
MDGEQSARGQETKMNLSKFLFRLMKRRVASPADGLGPISEEGVTIAPSVGWENPPDGQWRQMMEHWQVQELSISNTA